ncbi:MAG: hypothetical protein PWQ49_410 [Methanohalophilus sp.]|nr:hypothetical protein [Methanohalophilus sp.]
MPTSLSHYLNLNKSSVTSIIDSLEKAGFVIRNIAPDDHRKCLISLSSEGRQHLEFLDTWIENIVEEVTKYVDDSEYEELLSSMRKIVEIERRIEARLLEGQNKPFKQDSGRRLE